MFEKEAEEYSIKSYGNDDWTRTHIEDIEIDYIRKCIAQSYLVGAEFGYNKANEWHYVKDRLPKELHDVLCFVIHNEHRYVLQGYLREGRWVLSPLGTYLNDDDVIAWKEIVLPKERA